jgi:hypothetical protein
VVNGLLGNRRIGTVRFAFRFECAEAHSRFRPCTASLLDGLNSRSPLSFARMASSMARRPGNPSNAQPSVFLTSCETLKAMLSDHQRRTFANGDAKQALDAARRLDDDNRDDSRFRSSMSTVNDWIVGVQRYFSVVDTFVSAKPEVAALVWGGIRFLIEVCPHTFDGW